MITGKPNNEVWFDNRMAKPPHIDGLTPYSVLVFYEISESVCNLVWEARAPHLKMHGGFFAGQYDYAKQEWDVLPGDVFGPCPDQYVVRWMHIPGYAEAVQQGG